MNGNYKTGEKAPQSGVYGFVRHTGNPGPPYCKPTPAEQEVPLAQGERFPPHKSCGQGAYWRLVRAA